MEQFQETLQILAIMGVVLALPLIWVIAYVFTASQKYKRLEDLMKETAAVVGLQYKDHCLFGEEDGVRFQIGLQALRTSSEPRGRYVVRAQVPGQLPRGFLAQPSKWTPWLDKWADKQLNPGHFTSGHEVLDKAYCFDSDDRRTSIQLLADPEVQQALISLLRPPGAGWVVDDDVYIAFEEGDMYPRVLQNPENVRYCIDTVVKAALVLERAHSRIRHQAQVTLAS